jgi:hypothetical protein
MIYISQCSRKKRRDEQAGRRRSKKTEEGDKHLLWGRRRHSLTANFTLAVYMRFLVAADKLGPHREKPYALPQDQGECRGCKIILPTNVFHGMDNQK